MAGMLMNYTYTDTKTGNTYSGQVVADATISKYNYQPGGTYTYGGGTYKMDTAPPTPTNAPSGSVYQTSYYDKSSNKTYDSYHYDMKNNDYYDVMTAGYDKTTGMYTPPGSTPVPMWSTKDGLGSEYGYVKTADNSYHVYGGGGTAQAMITPSTMGMTTYYFEFAYPDHSYYLGKVTDDGTYGYKVGSTIPTATGTYSIYAVDASKPAPTALAGQVYDLLYHDAGSGDYPPSGVIPTSPYYQKPNGYGGLTTETDYVQKPGGYYQYSYKASADASQPVATLPLPT